MDLVQKTGNLSIKVINKIPCALFFISIFLLTGDIGAVDSFNVVRSDEKGMVIEFSLPQVTVKEYTVGGEVYHVVRGGGIPVGEEIGYPQVEMFLTTVGIPPDSRVHAVLTPQKTEVLKRLRLLPVRVDERAEVRDYSPDYRRGGKYPARILEVSEPGFIRRQRVVSMKIYPFRVDPLTGDVEVVHKARIELRFTGGSGYRSDPGVLEESFEGIYRNVLLNYEEAREWKLRTPRTGVRQPSPFFEGEWWLKVVVSDEGMYRVTYDDILDAGLNPSMIDPVTFQMFYGGGRELPWGVADSRPELEETAIEVAGAGDGSFDPGDEVVFYGQSLLRWEPQDTYLRHRYDSSNCYWLTWGNPDASPLRMVTIDGTPGVGVEVVEYRDNKHVEQDHIYATEEFAYTRVVPDDWVWDNISGTVGEPITRSYTFQLDEVAGGGMDSLRLEVYGQPGTVSHLIEVSLNGVRVRDISFSGPYSHNTSWFSLPIDLLNGGSNTLTLHLPRNTSALAQDAIYMGWFDVNAVYTLGSAGDGLIFNGQSGTGSFRYRLGDSSASSPHLYLVSDPYAPSAITNFSVEGDDLVFELPGASMPDRIIFLDRDNLRKPQSITVVDNLTLRSTGNGADYIVITSPELEGEAQEIAMYRAQGLGLMTMVITADRIFNEFSWGISDVTAFRDFLKYTFESWEIAPTMVLFLGDGHYDYKNFTSAGRNKLNPLPPHISNDLVIEDWFVRFDSDPNPDMIYGRIPVRTSQEARVAVQKIIDYETDPEFGSWKSRAILVADDYFTESRRCESLPHSEQTEEVDERLPTGMERIKIYMLEYPFDPPETGFEKPDVTEEILKEWNRGALLINFVGHGSYRTWAHEKAFHMPDDFPRLDNGVRLPMIIAASCEIGRFDDPAFDGMIEDMLKTPGKGAVASFSATRATFSSPNKIVNNNLIEELFSDPVESPYLGEAAVTAKIRTGGSNASRYTLFGDPATKLALPGVDLTFTDTPDSLRPLGLVSLSGEIRINGMVAEEVEGFAEVRVFDPPVRKVFDECTSQQSFMTAGNPLFNGVVSVNEGRFTTTFRVPSNVPSSLPADTTALNNARIYTYLDWADGDGYGAVDSIDVSLAASPVEDSIAPTIKLTLNGRELTGGDDLGIGQEVLIEIYDESGVNITGSPGHQILAEIDGGSVREDMTDEFRYDVDSYQGGSVGYTIPALEPGEHRFNFRASDNALNIAHMEINLDVFSEAEVKLSEVLIYPNPFRDNCYFTFEVTQPSEIMIKIYTVAGRLIQRIERSVGSGYNQIEWNGRDWRGDQPANGVYLCYVRARSVSGEGGVREDEQLVKALLSR